MSPVKKQESRNGSKNMKAGSSVQKTDSQVKSNSNLGKVSGGYNSPKKLKEKSTIEVEKNET